MATKNESAEIVAPRKSVRSAEGEWVGYKELAAMRKNAARYLFMRENIDFTDNGDGTGFYWHNQRGEFSFAFRNDPDGRFRPTFESVIDAEMAKQNTVPANA